ncbi:MFS transporter [Pseudoduganella sp. FT26W]|uniref:MFS transporter n=1 Tax=Duganella aquatilis TaxID=2666082 RepID=A0A844CUW9_9BURK|nr:MFS transporter [Duganella aquatilis]MRW84163.1 MFS transporter [Duganella aquatilis]
MQTAALGAQQSSPPQVVNGRQRYLNLAGAWVAWLFDALDAGIFGFVMLSIAQSFSVQLGDVVSTVAWFLLATGIGGYFLGNISDRIGRKKTIVLSVFTYGTATLLCGFAHSLLELNIYRAILGVAVGGLWSAAAALISEVWKPEGRAKAIAVLQTGWSGGNLLAAVLAWNVLKPNDPDAWRTMFIVASVPAFATLLFVMCFMKESPVWLANRGFMAQNTAKGKLLAIFQPQYLRATLLALTVSILGMWGYWILLTFTPAFLQNILKVRINEAPVFLVWSGLGAMAGYLVFGMLAERIGRRKSFALFFLGMTLMVPLFTLTVNAMPLVDGKLQLTASNVFILGSLSAVLGFFTGYFSGFGAWYAELFPTSIRSTAAGFCFNFGRVGAIAGIKLVPVLIPLIGFTYTISLASVAYLLAAIMVFTLQETKGIQLTSGN